MEESHGLLQNILHELQELRDKIIKNRLDYRVSTLVEKINDGGRNNPATGPGLPQSPLHAPEKALLLGDTNLLRCWKTRGWTGPLPDVLSTVRFHKLMDNASSYMIFDDLGSLFLDLKENNDAMHMFVCKLVPALRLNYLTI